MEGCGAESRESRSLREGPHQPGDEGGLSSLSVCGGGAVHACLAPRLPPLPGHSRRMLMALCVMKFEKYQEGNRSGPQEWALSRDPSEWGR